MMLFIIFYDEYIDRPKLTEQKKPVEYIVPPSPQKNGFIETPGAVKISLRL